MIMKKFIGPHVSISGGVFNAPVNARVLGATGFGMFTKNQRQWVAKPFDTSEIDAFKKSMVEYGYSADMVLVHDSYLINIGSPDIAGREKSINALTDEVVRCSQLGLTLLNIHPGSHLKGFSVDECLKVIAESINIVHDKTTDSGVTIVLETVAGQGTNVGATFEELAGIIDNVEDKSRVGVCIDTCHIFAAGYDIRDKKSYDDTMSQFEKIINIKYLRGLHLNDAKKNLGSKIDRHDSIGKGEIGLDAFRFIMQDKRLDNIPCVLETIDETIWQDEVSLLKQMAGE